MVFVLNGLCAEISPASSAQPSELAESETLSFEQVDEHLQILNVGRVMDDSSSGSSWHSDSSADMETVYSGSVSMHQGHGFNVDADITAALMHWNAATLADPTLQDWAGAPMIDSSALRRFSHIGNVVDGSGPFIKQEDMGYNPSDFAFMPVV